MKYFFLADGWTVGRVWGVGGLWDEVLRRRSPDIQRLNFCLSDPNETLWLYRAEDAVLMIEVKPVVLPSTPTTGMNIGQVVLTRLMTADQVLERLCGASAQCNIDHTSFKESTLRM
ncbi:MAG: hypothetical protein ACFBSC_17335 [Microcoleaceae cyanobacterium]